MERRKALIIVLLCMLLGVVGYWIFFMTGAKKALNSNSRITRVPNSLDKGRKVDHEIKQINVEYFKRQKELMESKGESYISKYQLEPKERVSTATKLSPHDERQWEDTTSSAVGVNDRHVVNSDPEFDKFIAKQESQWGNFIESELQQIEYKNKGTGSKITYLNNVTAKADVVHKKSVKAKQSVQMSESVRLPGDKDFGIIEGELNTDIKSPVLATVLSGPLKGGKLIGEFQLDDDHVTIKFDKLSFHQTSISINAIAIDPNKYQVGLADSVNRHLIGRYGSLFTSSFLEGVFEAIKRNPVVYSTGNTNVQEASTLSRRDQMLQAAGKTGQAFTPFAKQYFNRPTTVKLNQGRGIGILYMDKVELNHG